MSVVEAPPPSPDRTASCADCGAPCSRRSARCMSCARPRYQYWTEATILACIQTWKTRFGAFPTQKQWARGGTVQGVKVPSRNTVVRHFGSWTKALALAGATTHRRAPGEGYLYVQRGKDGLEVWYARWSVGERYANGRLKSEFARIGFKTGPGALTRLQAERHLELMLGIVEDKKISGPGHEAYALVRKAAQLLDRAYDEAPNREARAMFRAALEKLPAFEEPLAEGVRLSA